MVEVEAEQLTRAGRGMHGAEAYLAQSVPVRETFGGKTVWEGVVHVFDLIGHPPQRAPMPGHRRSRGARSAGSLPCCIGHRSIAHKLL
jgi:hypothetical protein